jgi:hypothetical protein
MTAFVFVLAIQQNASPMNWGNIAQGALNAALAFQNSNLSMKQAKEFATQFDVSDIVDFAKTINPTIVDTALEKIQDRFDPENPQSLEYANITIKWLKFARQHCPGALPRIVVLIQYIANELNLEFSTDTLEKLELLKTAPDLVDLDTLCSDIQEVFNINQSETQEPALLTEFRHVFNNNRENLPSVIQKIKNSGVTFSEDTNALYLLEMLEQDPYSKVGIEFLCQEIAEAFRNHQQQPVNYSEMSNWIDDFLAQQE